MAHTPNINFTVDDAPLLVPTASTETSIKNKNEERRIFRNIIVICIAFMFLFTAFSSVSMLQSSINKVEGTTSLATLYMSMVLSGIFLPTWLIKKFNAKWTMCFSMLCYSTYIAAQFYPRDWTLIPTSLVLGLGAAPLWAAKCSYFTQIAGRYAVLVGETTEIIVIRFFGTFFFFFHATRVFGYVFSSVVLSPGVEKHETRIEEALKVCGVNFCPSTHTSPNTNVTNLAMPPMSKIYTLTATYLVLALLAPVVVALFVDPLSRLGKYEHTDASRGESGWDMVMATFRIMTHPYQLLIFPLALWSGIEQGFVGADFTAAYVTCGLGVHMVGILMMVEAVSNGVWSITFSPLVKRFGRFSVFTFSAIVNYGIIVVQRYWMPRPDDINIFYVMAFLWGAMDAVWQTQVNALYGVLFPEETEASFSCYRVGQSLGYIITFVLSSTTCMWVKLRIMEFSLLFGMVCYYTFEVTERTGGLKRGSDGKVESISRLIKDKLILVSYSLGLHSENRIYFRYCLYLCTLASLLAGGYVFSQLNYS